ncbi:CD225/dispanin family protein [Frigoriglobus tundricola]|uniref:Polyribonucleotide nucleotidyltransferase n=1 Tax=Frigoriglobus tundricola TaxID=2774151 RepID=A0A6M5YKG0_9BACT|nr:CD225/dispanin family protein [Frigoriglobus tundricola]QJW94435.1 Polyribonucleotide nucleotidyltransferase [Frigoriglobus tundricola]
MARERYDDDEDYDDRPRRRRRDDDEDDYDDRPRRRPPPNYLVPAVLTTLLCCLPAGVAAIVFAAQVNSKWEAGDYAGARQAAANAKLWAWVSFGLGVAVFVISFVLGFLVVSY